MQAEQLLETAKELNRRGLNHGTAGNVSVRTRSGFMVTPSALAYDQSTPEDMVQMSYDGDYLGQRKPSSEWRFHRDIYQNFDQAKAIIHTHSIWCTTLACQQREIPPFHYMIALAGGNTIRCAPYATFGTQKLSDNIIKAMQDRKACLLAHHGVIVYGADLGQAIELLTEVEFLAQAYMQALQLGEVPLLSEQNMQEVIEKFGNYRPS